MHAHHHTVMFPVTSPNKPAVTIPGSKAVTRPAKSESPYESTAEGEAGNGSGMGGVCHGRRGGR
ncbi:MAG: hypothetical protein EB010_10840 [Acidimicrobiia bacterium]|nr:hypothetical protein [Acidimicrobiia bacterium]